MGSADDPATSRFKAELHQYGIEDRFQRYVDAIKSSYLTAGQLPLELQEHDKRVLQQLGIGWPVLADYGRAMAQEMLEGVLSRDSELLRKLTETFPPRMLSLFLAASRRDKDVYVLRLSEAPKTFDELLWVDSPVNLISQEKLHAHVLRLAKELTKSKLAISHTTLPYPKAKWNATFIYFPGSVATTLTEVADAKGGGLEEVEARLQEYSLLRQSPVPSIGVFESNGVRKERLVAWVEDAIRQGAITGFVETGPAYLVLNEASYRELVLRPAFERVVASVLEQGDARASRRPEEWAPERSPPEKTASGPSGIVVLGGRDANPPTGLLGWEGDVPVRLSLAVGQDPESKEEKSQTITVVGVQASGKSYTTGVILEMAIKSIAGINDLSQPLAGIVFHYSQNETYAPEFFGLRRPNPVEKDVSALARLGATPDGINDIVCLVPPLRLETRRAELPELEVQPLLFNPDELGLEDWQLLMGVPGSETLYMELIKKLLQDLNQRGPITLGGIREAVEGSPLSEGQRRLVATRLSLAERYLGERRPLGDYLSAGRLVIVDIRDNMVDKVEAMRLCLICLRLFQKSKVAGANLPKIVVLDEAHKYLETGFGLEIETVVREMRHTATAVIIASQDPLSIPEKVIGLSSVLILHQITSPDWVRHIKRGCDAVGSLDSNDLSALESGHAFVWARRSTDPRFTRGMVRVRIRPRVTQHGVQ